MVGEVLPASRSAIRSYLMELLDVLVVPEREDWPRISSSLYRQIESELHARTSSLFQQFRGKSKAEKEYRLAVRLYSEFCRHLLWLDWSISPHVHRVRPEWEKLVKGRPRGKMEFDQLFCTIDSTYRRVERLLPYVPDDGKVLCLGDDDLCSLALSECWGGEVHVIDVDERLLSFIGDRNPAVQCHRIDLDNDAIPQNLAGQFDVVLYDPPWEKYPAWLFLQWASACLKDSPNARILLSLCPLYLEHDERKMDRVLQDIVTAGFTFDSVDACFNLYSMGSENNPELRRILDDYDVPVESPLMEVFARLPYVFSNLYTLRRLSRQKHNPVTRLWRKMRRLS